jgi:hypothetical protein
MNEVLLLLQNGPSLTEREKLEIINLGWLFRHVSASCAMRAMRRIAPLFDEKSVDAHTYMSAVREIAQQLQSALESRRDPVVCSSPS